MDLSVSISLTKAALGKLYFVVSAIEAEEGQIIRVQQSKQIRSQISNEYYIHTHVKLQ